MLHAVLLIGGNAVLVQLLNRQSKLVLDLLQGLLEDGLMSLGSLFQAVLLMAMPTCGRSPIGPTRYFETSNNFTSAPGLVPVMAASRVPRSRAVYTSAKAMVSGCPQDQPPGATVLRCAHAS